MNNMRERHSLYVLIHMVNIIPRSVPTRKIVETHGDRVGKSSLLSNAGNLTAAGHINFVNQSSVEMKCTTTMW